MKLFIYNCLSSIIPFFCAQKFTSSIFCWPSNGHIWANTRKEFTIWKQLLSTTLLHTTARRVWRDCGRLLGIPYLMTFLDMLRRVLGLTVSFGGHARSKQSNLHCSENITVNICFQRLWMGDFEVPFLRLNRPQLKQKPLVFHCILFRGDSDHE